MQSTAERIKALVESSGKSQRDLAKEMGVSNVSISQWTTGKNPPGKSGVSALAKYFNVTPSYILYGDGDAPATQEVKDASDSIAVPLLDVGASCGGGYVNDDETLITLVRVNRNQLKRVAPWANERALNIITIHGDSMEPTFHDGDNVVIDVSSRRIKSDGVYIINMQDGTFAKRVQVRPNSVCLISDNPRYPPFEVGEQDCFEIVGRCVVGLCVRYL